MVDLKFFREQAQLTQSQLAERLNLSQSIISRSEANPGGVQLDQIVSWLAACGTDLATAIKETGRRTSWQGIDPGQPYQERDRNVDHLEKYVEKFGPEPIRDGPAGAPSSRQVTELIPKWREKPTVLLAGRFDSGKSRLANFLLGTDVLPSLYTKTTKIPMFLRHIDQKPKWQAEQVWILDTYFDPKLWNKEDHCTQCRLIGGGLDTLRAYGTHLNTDGVPWLEREAGAALIYLDSKLLSACDLIDIPGIAENDIDERRGNIVRGLADILIYTSPAISHLDKQDFGYLRGLLPLLPSLERDAASTFPTLGNLFVVATHAHEQISEDQLKTISESGSKRLFWFFKETIWEPRSLETQRPITEQRLTERHFSFWKETPERYQPLINDLSAVLSSHIPRDLIRNVSQQIGAIKRTGVEFYENQAAAYNRTLSDLSKAKEAFAEAAARKKSWTNTLKAAHDAVVRDIRKKKEGSIRTLETTIKQKLTSPDLVEAFIRDKFSKSEDPQKEAEDLALILLVDSAEYFLREAIAKSSEEIDQKINEYLDTFSPTGGGPESRTLPTMRIPFDSRAALAAGITGGAVTSGALAVWASSLGTTGSLVLTTKIAGLLSTVGLTTVGAASAAAAITAIGVPLAVLMGVVGAAAAYLAAKQPWQVRLTKAIIGAINSGQYFAACRTSVERYWDDTERAFTTGAREIEEQFYQHQEAYAALLQQQDQQTTDQIKDIVARLDEQKCFFEGLPWNVASD